MHLTREDISPKMEMQINNRGMKKMKMQNSADDVLACKNLEKSYQSGSETIQIIRPVSFRIQSGTKNLITGKSGSGKTTLLTLLAGIEPPTGGEVYYNGIDYYRLSERKQAHIRGISYGFVFQAFHLIPELTVEDNIMVPAIINGGPVDIDFYKKMQDMLQLETKKAAYPAELSGGEQQRVAIARAMILQPAILFADEPTGNLDQENGQRIMALLDELNHRFNTTIIMVTHDSQLMKNPDCRFHISDGAVSCEMAYESGGDRC